METAGGAVLLSATPGHDMTVCTESVKSQNSFTLTRKVKLARRRVECGPRLKWIRFRTTSVFVSLFSYLTPICPVCLLSHSSSLFILSCNYKSDSFTHIKLCLWIGWLVDNKLVCHSQTSERSRKQRLPQSVTAGVSDRKLKRVLSRIFRQLFDCRDLLHTSKYVS